MMSIRRSLPDSSLLESERASYLILSRASEQLETSRPPPLDSVDRVDSGNQRPAQLSPVRDD